MNLIVAVDPGASGGISFDYGGRGVRSIKMPETDGDIIAAIRSSESDMTVLCKEGFSFNRIAVIEKVGGYMGSAMPGAAMFNFGDGYGFIRGVLQTMGYRIEMVRPQDWMKALALGNVGTVKASRTMTPEEKKIHARQNAELKRIWKNKLKDTAQRLFPDQTVTLKTADSLLILEYARLTSHNRSF